MSADHLPWWKVMLNTLKSVLENDLKVAQDRIKAEEFTGY